MMSDEDIQAELRSMSDEEREANDIAEAEQMSMYAIEFKAHKAALQQQFTDYIYNNYTVGNGDQLINVLEDGEALESFLDLMGLPEDTEIDL